MVRETAIWFEVEGDQLGFDPVKHARQRQTGHAVAAVRCDPKGTDLFRIDDREQMVDVAGDRVQRLHRSPRSGWTHALLSEVPDLEKSGRRPDRGGTLTTELDPVPLGRVVRSGDHRTRNITTARNEVQGVCGDLPDVDHVD